MAPSAAQCQALQLSDSERCTNEATNADGLFCRFHAKQAYGLYMGYKRRNERLEAMDDEGPRSLKKPGASLANETFEDIEDEKTLREIHGYLFDKYVLLGKVIDARRLHRKHFYSLNLDYGHQAYIDRLTNRRQNALQALCRVEKRTARVLYQKEQWFSWVRKIQEEEEAIGETEKKKVKLEAALFQRHWKQMQARLQLKRQKDEKKLQDAYLEDAFRERMAMSADELNDDETWDPIEDMAQDERNRYVDLIEHFLWMGAWEAEEDAPPTDPEGKPEGSSPKKAKKKRKRKKKSKAKGGAANETNGTANSPSSGSSTSIDATTNSNRNRQQRLLSIEQNKQDGAPADLQEPDKSNIETKEEMRKRLKETGKEPLSAWCWRFWQFCGALMNPDQNYEHIVPMDDEEIESIVKEITEIKVLLFCRLLLAQASLLPAALRATNVREFLQDPGIPESDLRDLCLKVEKPSLQEIRDACADFARGDEVDDDDEEETDEEYEDESFEDLILDDSRYYHLHSQDWLFDNVFKKLRCEPHKKKKKEKKIKVTICGKSIWNHSSGKSMSRDGWFQFSVMAKDCDFGHAIQLCRNWNEFYELNLLAKWKYFNASSWKPWSSDSLVDQLQEMKLFPYFVDLEVGLTHSYASADPDTYDYIESKNVIAAYMKRNDPVTRRFLQYLKMRTGEVALLVRDGKTGRVITAPPEEYMWTYRRRNAVGETDHSKWDQVLKMGPQFFELTGQQRQWKFGFTDYYDIVIWDLTPNKSRKDIFNLVMSELRRASRFTQPRDLYVNMKPVLQTLTVDTNSMRSKQIKPGEDAVNLGEYLINNSISLRKTVARDNVYMGVGDVGYACYSAANAAEDQVLFPDELTSENAGVAFREIKDSITRFETIPRLTNTTAMAQRFEKLTGDNGPLKAHASINTSCAARPWALPRIFKTGLKQLLKQDKSTRQRLLLRSTNLSGMPKKPNLSDQEVPDRDKAIGFKESFHDGDLEPGATANFREVQAKITLMLDYAYSGPTDWIWFLVDILKWLGLQAKYDTKAQDSASPWSHDYIVQDLVQAVASMAMFFPKLKATAPITDFLQSSQCEDFRNSLLFNPKERCKTRPDRRGPTSYKFRDKEFWNEWNKLKGPEFSAGDYPMDWGVAMCPIIAHLYVKGIIAPSYIQNDEKHLSGIVTANTEPHRPGKLDLFISYEDTHGVIPAYLVSDLQPPDQWPELLPYVQSFAAKHPKARFSLLRMWSAPHYYPYILGQDLRNVFGFLDSVSRSWEWRCVPKDMPGSECSAHNITAGRLARLQAQFKENVVNRGDLILVMGADEQELFKFCTAVTFAMQTKPWMSEVDPWKSFVNVDLDFVMDLDSYWLD